MRKAQDQEDQILKKEEAPMAKKGKKGKGMRSMEGMTGSGMSKPDDPRKHCPKPAGESSFEMTMIGGKKGKK